MSASEVHKYKLTVAIGELHLGKVFNHEHQFAGIIYPAIRMWANGDNLALLPWYVEKNLEFRKALHVRVTARTDKIFNVNYEDEAHDIDESGKLIWLGRLRNWTLKPGQTVHCVATQGVDEDGDYSAADDGQPCHWTLIDGDTNETIKPA